MAQNGLSLQFFGAWIWRLFFFFVCSTSLFARYFKRNKIRTEEDGKSWMIFKWPIKLNILNYMAWCQKYLRNFAETLYFDRRLRRFCQLAYDQQNHQSDFSRHTIDWTDVNAVWVCHKLFDAKPKSVLNSKQNKSNQCSEPH